MADVWVNHSTLAEEIEDMDKLISNCKTYKAKIECYGKRMKSCVSKIYSSGKISTERVDSLIGLLETLRGDMYDCLRSVYEFQSDDTSTTLSPGQYTYLPGGNRVPVSATSPSTTTTPTSIPTNGGAGVATTPGGPFTNPVRERIESVNPTSAPVRPSTSSTPTNNNSNSNRSSSKGNGASTIATGTSPKVVAYDIKPSTEPATAQLRMTEPITSSASSPAYPNPKTPTTPISGNSHGGDIITSVGETGTGGNTFTNQTVTEVVGGDTTTGGSGVVITEAPVEVLTNSIDGVKNGASFVLPTSSKARIQTSTTSTAQKNSALPVLAGLGAAAIAAGIGVKLNNKKKKEEEEKK